MALLNLRAIRRAIYGSLLKKGEAIGLRTSILVVINKDISQTAGNRFIRRRYLYLGLSLIT